MPEQESQSISSEQLDLVEQIERRIFLIRGHKVLLDSDLAKLYGVSTGHLNEQVRRNHGRFPADFMFALTTGEADALRSQIAISKAHRGGRRYLPLVFTEQGVAMLSSPFQHLHLQSHLKTRPPVCMEKEFRILLSAIRRMIPSTGKRICLLLNRSTLAASLKLQNR